MSLNAPLWRDSNQAPVQIGGVVSRKTQTLSGNNTTVATPLWSITGVVNVVALYGVVTADLGANHTAAAYRLNDQTAQVDITLATGSTLSGFKAGSAFFKRGLAATAVTIINNSAGRANDPTAASLQMFSPIILTKKTGAATNIEYVYATTDTPTSGTIQHFCIWLPVSQDAAVTAQ